MEHGAVFRDVDLVAEEHGFQTLFDAALFRELEEQLEGLVGDAVLRVIEEEAGGFEGKARAALRVLVEELTERGLRDLCRVRLQRLPCRLFEKSGGWRRHDGEAPCVLDVLEGDGLPADRLNHSAGLGAVS